MSRLDSLVQRTVTGDQGAWRELQIAVEPTIIAIAKRNPALRRKGLASSLDAQREIAVATLERFARDDFHNLRRFLEGPQNPESTAARDFDPWLYHAVQLEAQEYLRKLYGRAPKAAANGASRPRASKRDVNSQAGRIDDPANQSALLATLGMTTKLTVAEVFAHVDQTFEPEEAEALRLFYLQDLGFEDIAQHFKLDDVASAKRLIRRLNARLRECYASERNGA